MGPKRGARVSVDGGATGAFFEAHPLPVLVFDPATTKILAANPAARAHYGFDAATFRSMTIDDLHPEDERARLKAVRARFTPPFVTPGTMRHRRQDGSEFDAVVSVFEVAYRGRRARMALITDVTLTDARGQELRDLRLAIDQGPTIVVLTDTEGRIAWVNRRFREVSGFEHDDVIGKPMGWLADPRQHAQAFDAVRAAVAKDGLWRGEVLNRTKDGGSYWEAAVVSAVRDAGGEVRRFIKVAEDVTATHALSERVDYLAHYDPVTDLPNRTAFERQLLPALAAARAADRKLAVLYLELNGYRLVHDSLGQDAGDDMLRAVARRLRGLGDGAVAARFGGDEFAVLTRTFEDAVEATGIAQRVVGALVEPLTLAGRPVALRPRVGVAVFPDHAERPADLMKAASQAKFRAKSARGPSYAFFRPAMEARARERLALESDLRAALGSGQLVLHYQPRIQLYDGRLAGVEALVRWQHPERGLLGPNAFVPLAEETGMIVDLGREVLQQACVQLRRWQDAGWTVPRVGVNLSTVELRAGGGLVEQVRAALSEARLAPQRLELEVTETAALVDGRGAEVLTELRSIGVLVTLDDFGTGYASLAHLRELPIDALKLDQRFLERIGRDDGAAAQPPPHPDHPPKNTAERRAGVDVAILRAVATLGRALGVPITAEGVETPEQLIQVRDAGCDAAQGFLLSRPEPADALAKAVGVASKRVLQGLARAG